MSFESKKFKNNSFILYDLNDEIVCYFDSFSELSNYLNYSLRNLIKEYNRHKSDEITIVIDSKKYKLATFC